MSIESYIRAMPKAELYVQLEGTMQKETLLLIAEQNDVKENTKRFAEWVKLLDKPNYERLDEIIRISSGWLRHGEDITRIVYDLGVSLHKQNVRYAEVSVNPALYMQDGLSYETILEALQDGRDRVQRAWGVRIVWILGIQREEPRRADEVARWAVSATGKKAGVIGLGLTGPESVQPAGQFERAFKAAEKKGAARVANAGDKLGAVGILDAINTLGLDRVLDGWGAADAPDVLALLRDKDVTLVVSMARSLCLGLLSAYNAYPLRALYDEDIKVCLGAGMPSLYKSSLTEEYLAAVEHCGMTIAELEEIALNAVQRSLLSSEEKAAMTAEFRQAYETFRAEHIAPEQAS